MNFLHYYELQQFSSEKRIIKKTENHPFQDNVDRKNHRQDKTRFASNKNRQILAVSDLVLW